MAIGSDVDIRSGQVLNQFLRAHKTIVEDHVAGNAAFRSQRLQSFTIPFTLMAFDMGMGCSGNDVNHVLMSCQNRRQRTDHILDSLVWRQQAERKQYTLSWGAKRTDRTEDAPRVRSSQSIDRKAEQSLRALRIDSHPVHAGRCAASSPPASQFAKQFVSMWPP